jgi:hypothetical protein
MIAGVPWLASVLPSQILPAPTKADGWAPASDSGRSKEHLLGPGFAILASAKLIGDPLANLGQRAI